MQDTPDLPQRTHEVRGEEVFYRFSNGLTIKTGGASDRPTDCVIRENFAEKFGASFFVPSENEDELAFGRVFENFIPQDRR